MQGYVKESADRLRQLVDQFGSQLAALQPWATSATPGAALEALGAAPLASPALTGNPTAPTPVSTDNDTSLATTAFVRAAMALFGLGAERVYSGDLNGLITPGLYSVSAGSTNWPFGGSGGTLIALMHGGGDYASQLALSVTDSRILKRAKVGASWSEWQELWHTGNLVKQTGPTDTTAGALMAVGAFGLGGRNNTTNASVDALESGFHILQRRVSGGNTPSVFTDGDYGVVLKNNYLAGLAKTLSSALAYGTSSRRLWWLTSLGTSLEDLKLEIYTSRSILGTVSQAGGVPTGAIIERGSNANGEYVRFADGTQICWSRRVRNATTQPGQAKSVGVTTAAGFVGEYETFADGTFYSGADATGQALYTLPLKSGVSRYLWNQGTSPNSMHFAFSVGSLVALSTLENVMHIGRWY